MTAVQLDRLGTGDVDGGFALSTEANWNQTRADWKLMLSMGEGFGLRDESGRLLATAMFLDYGPSFAWICMVLVTPSERRKGHATRLMRSCLDRLEVEALVAGLDATPAGREVYRRLGFREIYGLTRLQIAAGAIDARSVSGIDVRPMDGRLVTEVARYDATIFGADRTVLLAEFLRRRPRHAFAAFRGGALCGYVLARDGRVAMQIGPLCADDEAAAIALVSHAMAQGQGAVFVDVADHQDGLRRWLEERGFGPQRTFTRMLRHRSAPLDTPAHVFLIAGAELG